MVLLQFQLNIPLRESHICTGLHGITIISTVLVMSFTPIIEHVPRENHIEKPHKRKKAKYQELVESCRSTKVSWFQRDARQESGCFWCGCGSKEGIYGVANYLDACWVWSSLSGSPKVRVLEDERPEMTGDAGYFTCPSSSSTQMVFFLYWYPQIQHWVSLNRINSHHWYICPHTFFGSQPRHIWHGVTVHISEIKHTYITQLLSMYSASEWFSIHK